ncbi:TRAP transporter small permease [Litoreibacter albidus]|uniref:TRAP transporter small permease protein n=1 Tax=Litoreibacter albidus TaxID=670155 RepID=A0A1H3AT23_9RHOB|nr:TRAP transporter small permease [Litoreibacter albidus]SDX32755.1 TRAP-type C4-dicarboxylate transport system, small permease component [Litoreibacter albidus]
MSQSQSNTTLGALARAEDFILAALGRLLIVFLAGMIGVVALQVLTRYLFDWPLTWSEEVARLFFISLIFVSAAVLARRREHLTVTIVTDLLPPRGRHIADALASLVGLICSTFLLRGAWDTFLREWDQRTPALQFPMGTIYGLLLISCVLLVFWLFLNLVISLRDAAINAPHTGGGPGANPEISPEINPNGRPDT